MKNKLTKEDIQNRINILKVGISLQILVKNVVSN